MTHSTDQERFWAGTFGDDYSTRNIGPKLIASNAAFFTQVLRRIGTTESIIELGANIGLNLHALRSLLPNAELSAVEINQAAADALQRSGQINPIWLLMDSGLVHFQGNRAS